MIQIYIILLKGVIMIAGTDKEVLHLLLNLLVVVVVVVTDGMFS